MKLTVTINGNETNDLVLALEEIVTKVEQGYLSGMDSNDTGRFDFDITED